MVQKNTSKKPLKRSASQKFKDDNIGAAKWDLLEELFHDVYSHRKYIYQINFFRGIFFGLGSVIGGTIIIALLIWVLSLLAGVFPSLDNLFQNLSQLLETTKR